MTLPLAVDPLYVFYACAALAAILAVEAAYLLLSGAKDYRSGVNRRLAIADKESNREKVLLQLKRERGITDGNLKGLRRLLVQAGVRVDPVRIGGTMAACAIAGFVAATWVRGAPLDGLVGAIAGGTLLPLFIVAKMRKRRQRRFGEQLPEAIDVIVRSLRAGHPVPVAIGMVAKEMADPIGTEFGIVSDEVTYGSELEGALRNMGERIGSEDLMLLITSISIQSATGGNLSQMLENLARVIRDRFKMRRKIRGLSSEARASAWILNLAPFMVFSLINVTSPDFYANSWTHPIAWNIAIGALIWMTIGNLIMRKMINFNF